MKKLIKKILKEEFDDFSWVNDMGHGYQHGDLFDESDVCANDFDCPVNITNDVIVITYDFDEWKTLFRSHDSWVLDELINGTNGHYHDSDYYDEDEFNYSGGWWSDTNLDRFQRILYSIGVNENVRSRFDNQDIVKLSREVDHEVINNYFQTLMSNYCDDLSDIIENNRWKHVIHSYDEIINDMGITVGTDSRGYGKRYIEISVPSDLFDKLSEGTLDISKVFVNISERITDESWSDMFHETWDTDGFEPHNLIEEFLTKSEEYLVENGLDEVYDNLMKRINSLGFKMVESGEFLLSNTNNTYWLLTPLFDEDKVLLKLYRSDEHFISDDYTSDEHELIRSFKVPTSKLSDYVTNLSLKL